MTIYRKKNRYCGDRYDTIGHIQASLLSAAFDVGPLVNGGVLNLAFYSLPAGPKKAGPVRIFAFVF